MLNLCGDDILWRKVDWPFVKPPTYHHILKGLYGMFSTMCFWSL
jgi:hypothetical protein